MDDIIKTKNSEYSRYEELLIKRDDVKKAAFLYEREYVREFGELILEIFNLKIECIRKKKTIEFCQAALNYGKPVDEEKLQSYLKAELTALREQLNQMTEDLNNAKGGETITEAELLQVRKIYRRIVKRIHPDINPFIKDSKELQELWQRTIIAYKCNDLKDLEELEVLIFKAVSQMGDKQPDIEIPDIEERIREIEKEIEDIKSKDPYQYKYLLESEENIKEKKGMLREEKKSYEEYSSQLEAMMSKLLKSGVSFVWKMN